MRFPVFIFSMILFLSACSDSGNNGIPVDVIDPSDAMEHNVVPGHSSFRISLFDNPVYVDDDMGLYGENIRFATYGECKGVGYVIDIPREGWSRRSERLKQGQGYMVAEITDNGCTIAALYVDNIDSNGAVTLKSLAPLYGTYGRFAVVPRQFNIGAFPVDTMLYLVHPTTYTVELKKGEWVMAVPGISTVQLKVNGNNTGVARRDVIHISNGIFDDADIQVIQAAEEL